MARRWSPWASTVAAGQAAAGRMVKPSGRSSASAPIARRPPTSAEMRSLSLTRSSAGAAHRDAAAKRGERRQDRQLVDELRAPRPAGSRRASSARVAHADGADRLAAALLGDLGVDDGAEAAEHVQDGRAARVEPDAFDGDVRARGARRRRPPGRRPRRCRPGPGGPRLEAAARRSPTRGARPRLAATPKAASARSVWSRVGRGLGHRGRALGLQAGQQHGALHLRAGHVGPIVEWRGGARRARSAAAGRRARPRSGPPSPSAAP